MELKKHPDSDLFRKSSFYMSIGLMISLLFTVVAFEWKSYDNNDLVNLGALDADFEELQDIPITEQPPPPPPQVTPPEIIEVPDEQEIEQEIEVNLDVEVTEETVIEDVVFDEAPEEEAADEIFQFVEDQPTPLGGMKAFYAYVGKNMKYPAQARRMGIEGKVYITFVVGKDGALTDIVVLKGIGAGCDQEAIRVLSGAPKWKPGKQRGRPVRVRMQLPIIFKLN
ncbi:MAG: energy transducer TonB [Bacteroidetes bacterium]|nr:MAG: energy transducer TonB [Bacteroidota bacterium]